MGLYHFLVLRLSLKVKVSRINFKFKAILIALKTQEEAQSLEPVK